MSAVVQKIAFTFKANLKFFMENLNFGDCDNGCKRILSSRNKSSITNI